MASSAGTEESLSQLREVTGLSEEAARQLLQASNGSIEDAVALHFAGEEDAGLTQGQGSGSGFGSGSPPESLGGQGSRSTGAVDVQPGQAATESQVPRLFTGAEGPGVLPVTPADRQRTEEDPDQQTTPASQEAAGGIFSSLGRMFSSISQAVLGVASEEFDSFFFSRYGGPAPPFSKDCFGDAVKNTLAQGRLMLVWFHSEEGPATDSFCRQVLQNGLVLEMIRQNYVLWAGDVTRFEPGQIARLLGATIFPTVAVLEPLRHGYDHTFCLEWPLGTFAKPLFRLSPTTQGDPMNADQAIAALSSAAQDHHDAVQAREEQRTRREVELAEERHLRDEQDREFEESLLRDQLSAISASEAREAADVQATAAATSSSVAPTASADCGPAASPSTASAEAAAAKDEAAAREAEAAAAAAASAAAAVAAEEQRLKRGAEILAEAQPEPAGSSTAKISLKLPSGERMQRVFRADQALSEVYEWAHCCRPTAKPLRFLLCTSFPAKTLSERSASLRDAGLTPSAVVIMKEDLEADD